MSHYELRVERTAPDGARSEVTVLEEHIEAFISALTRLGLTATSPSADHAVLPEGGAPGTTIEAVQNDAGEASEPLPADDDSPPFEPVKRRFVEREAQRMAADERRGRGRPRKHITLSTHEWTRVKVVLREAYPELLNQILLRLEREKEQEGAISPTSDDDASLDRDDQASPAESSDETS